MRALVLIVWLSYPVITAAQVVVGASTDLSTTANTQFALNSNLTINSNSADFSKITLFLTGGTQTLTNGNIASSVILGGLVIGQTGAATGGTKSISGGTWEVNGSIVFNDGLVVPQTNSSGKIIHTKPTGSAGDIVVNNPGSYVNGTFYSKGTGTRIFPIGNTNGYSPAQLFNVTQPDVEVGMRVVESNSGLTHGTELLDVFEDRYWELFDNPQTLVGPTIALSTLSSSGFIEPTVGTVVVGSSGTSNAATSLGGAASGDFIVSATGITLNDRVFTLAKVNSDQVAVKIRNVVTPFLDNANDYLEIENIGIFPENKVILLDRWGVKVREWSGYVNVTGSPDPAYDLSDIATGNYICIVEYMDGSSTRKLSQMVTIINR